MFNLLITILAVGLLAAISIASVLYLGDTSEAYDTASAAEYISASQQISSAVDLYRVDNVGQFPKSINELIYAGYLKGKPAGNWTFQDGRFETDGISEKQCKDINEKLIGEAIAPLCSDPNAPAIGCCQT